MPAFNAPLDVGNRALQYCGAKRISSFTETSVNASEISFAYDKAREAELQERYWTFAIKRAVLRPRDGNMMLLNAALWSSTTTYFVGSIVADQSGFLWISNTPNNLNNDPLLTTFWEPYCGPLGIPLWDSGTTYLSGDVVYTTPGDGTNKVYLSLIDGNSDTPSTATAWSSTTVYFKNNVVTFNSVAYMSLIDLNTNNEPDLAPALWASGTTYSSGQKVGGSDGNIYQSVGNGNVGNNPVTDGGVHWTNTGVLNPWTTVFTGGKGSVNWLEIGGSDFPAGVTLKTLNINYPIGSGPSDQSISNNVFVLPANYLRRASQDPKRPAPALGGPSGFNYDDWLIEKPFLISRDAGFIILRFVADFTDVTRMHTMFCEGVAARIAFDVVERLTQSTAKKSTVAKTYQEWMDRARTVDAIEQGYDDEPDDDFIAVRA